MALFQNTEGEAEQAQNAIGSGIVMPVDDQVLTGGKAAGGPDPAAVIRRRKEDASFAERTRGGLPVVGLAVAGVAATALATGAATPVTGFTVFLMLLGGLSLVTTHVLRA